MWQSDLRSSLYDKRGGEGFKPFEAPHAGFDPINILRIRNRPCETQKRKGSPFLKRGEEGGRRKNCQDCENETSTPALYAESD